MMMMTNNHHMTILIDRFHSMTNEKSSKKKEIKYKQIRFDAARQTFDPDARKKSAV